MPAARPNPRMDRNQLQRIAVIAVALGTLSVLAILASYLALTDIWHGEADLRLEWRVLRIGLAVIVAFHVAALLALVRVLRLARQGEWRSNSEVVT